MRILLPLLMVVCAAATFGQQPSDPTTDPPERWNIFYQATSIGDYHGSFRALYSGPFSLQNYSERDVSLTTTLFLGFRLGRNTQVYVDPEIAGGRGFSGVDGIANAPNGELPRVASATPKPYLARAYFTQDFAFGGDRENFSSEANQLAGSRHAKSWSLRYGSAAEPKVANGLRFDRRLFRDRGDMAEGELRYAPGGHPGAIRLLGFWLHTDSGNYAEALRRSAQSHSQPDVTATHQVGRLKYGTGVNIEQEVTKDIGVFARLGWNDGKTESFAFTAIDRLASGGISVTGTRWKRPYDVAATALTVSGISGVHASYLARGGDDFLIGDGALQYGPEYAWESYYNARLFPGFFTTLDLQHIANPAYNQNRGPVWIWSLRLHIELGKESFSRRTP